MSTQHCVIRILAAVVSSLGLREACAADCEFAWQDGFRMPGVPGHIADMAIFDDGRGPALYLAGTIKSIAGLTVNHIARWDGSDWSALGTGLSGPGATSASTHSNCLLVFDNGTGPALYVGGYFSSAGGVTASRVARWNGQSWSALSTGSWSPNIASIIDMAVYDDGSGDALYVGGWFTKAGGVTVNGIARWTGTTWLPLAGGMGIDPSDPIVSALEVFDDSDGPKLYAGGHFTTAGGVTVNHVAHWDGTQWSSLEQEPTPPQLWDSVSALAVYADGLGSGESLYVGGLADDKGPFDHANLARWDGTEWSLVGDVIAEPGPTVNPIIRSLRVIDFGGTSELYVGGNYGSVGGVAANSIAKWNGQRWAALGEGFLGGPSTDNYVAIDRVIKFNAGEGDALYAGGTFVIAGTTGARSMAKWDGIDWSPIMEGNGMEDLVEALAVAGQGDDARLFAGGRFITAGTTKAAIAQWDGASWQRVGEGDLVPYGSLDVTYVESLVTLPVEDGYRLFAAGLFGGIGELALNNIAMWDGTTWSPLGAGILGCVGSFECGPTVYALSARLTATGYELYVGGHFVAAGTTIASNIARWDGAQWSPLRWGVWGTVRSLEFYDEGRGEGPVLFVGGSFTIPTIEEPAHVARWNGSDWSTVGSFHYPGPYGNVSALKAYDDRSGFGPALYVGGDFTSVDGQPMGDVARWNGQAWFPVGPGLGGGGTHGGVDSFAEFDQGDGPRLHAGGRLEFGSEVHHIAVWDGASWQLLAQDVGGESDDSQVDVRALAAVATGPAAGLYAGGRFTEAGGLESFYVARWACMSDQLPGDLNNDGDIDGFDLAILLAAWGPCPARGECPADANGDGIVNGFDLALLLGSWT